MNTDNPSFDGVLEIVGDLKDRVSELETARNDRTPRYRALAPGTQPDQPWAPCTREETRFYANLAHLT